jgi:hypothetical protein
VSGAKTRRLDSRRCRLKGRSTYANQCLIRSREKRSGELIDGDEARREIRAMKERWLQERSSSSSLPG